MEDLLRSHFASVLVECCPLNDLRLQRVVRLRYELPCKCLDDCRGVDAM
jgi:hypothetical protein